MKLSLIYIEALSTLTTLLSLPKDLVEDLRFHRNQTYNLMFCTLHQISLILVSHIRVNPSLFRMFMVPQEEMKEMIYGINYLNLEHNEMNHG